MSVLTDALGLVHLAADAWVGLYGPWQTPAALAMVGVILFLGGRPVRRRRQTRR